MKNLIILFASVAIFLISSCKKQTLAGLGGNGTLHISSMHHGAILDSMTIYIKFNTLEAPSENDFDLTMAVNKTTKLATFSELKKGNYYLLAAGWDPSISKEVKGGIPFTIEEENDINIVIPVTEKH
jgi:hypothetical protein